MKDLIDRIRSSFEGLSQSERLLVSIAGGMLLVTLVWFGGVQPVLGAATRAEARAGSAEQEVAAVRALSAEFQEVNGRLSAVEQRIRSGPKGEIFTTLEQMAKQAAVKVASMEPRTSPASDDYEETKVQVALKGVTLAQAVNYLHRIESAPQLLSVKALRIRTRSDKQELLDVTFTVSSFEAI